MDRKEVAERLRALASDDMNRSKAARLRDVFDDVEVALAAGVSRSLVIKELAAHGLELTLATFETSLKRIRQKRKKQLTTSVESVNKSQGQPIKPRETPPLVETNDEAENTIVRSHDPADLNKIFSNKPDLEALAKLAKRIKK